MGQILSRLILPYEVWRLSCWVQIAFSHPVTIVFSSLAKNGQSKCPFCSCRVLRVRGSSSLHCSEQELHRRSFNDMVPIVVVCCARCHECVCGGRDENYATNSERRRSSCCEGGRASSRSVTRAPKGCNKGPRLIVVAAATAEGITKSDPIFGSIELHLTPLNHTFNYLRAPKVVVIKLKLILAPALEYVTQFFCDLHSISTHVLLLFF